MSTRYAKSEQQLARARNVIPLGAQTFSKSITQLPQNVSPFFAHRGLGARLWDIDGNEYVDFNNALCSVTLGYCDADVNTAVAQQLEAGTVFTLSHALETEVAERICKMVPCAEMVRFGKNGSDATSGAIRIARAFTGRDQVISCGYHGWQDWYIGATARNKGVPAATSAMNTMIPYNDLPALEKALAQPDRPVAAVIMEPMNVAYPAPGYLERVAEITRAAGALLIFDETITGFRFSKGGAQELFGVTPDLATLGKGIANGFPLSVVCGRRDVMMEMEEVFFSFTMGGETLSLAAAKAVMAKLEEQPVVETMNARGTQLVRGVTERLTRHGVEHFITISGHPTWTFLNFSDADDISSWEIKTLWLQEIFERGILSVGSHVINYSHTEADIDRLLQVYDEVFPILRDAIKQKSIRQWLKCEPLQPLFKVR
ncbi:MAG: aminotransferase class III-fold pyridoxal phosphate-dependent enzyme [Rhizobiales bacterium]|nr:aminotransferase class III-fold pyridoxal phosphate-dependent enzyme [Hyphomicrobiales bacterium]